MIRCTTSAGRAGIKTTLRAGTLLQSSKLSLRLWMQAMYLLTSSKTNLAALELKRHLGVTYKGGLAHEAQDHAGDDRARRTANNSRDSCRSMTRIWAVNAAAASADEVRRTNSRS
ncbi:putative transposase [Xanthomonas oryzae pv. oryzae KACC 10331]|uniref:Transposase n=1 Tax=Xanthomonas oryzae pv. oryzae (strain KACC10331 / KXO85) TaxID=291331 RepID=Q5GY74_XANOR|nr:putative transposase [Xanthomonas oryzae pv. oryzae KACC 10331]